MIDMKDAVVLTKQEYDSLKQQLKYWEDLIQFDVETSRPWDGEHLTRTITFDISRLANPYTLIRIKCGDTKIEINGK